MCLEMTLRHSRILLLHKPYQELLLPFQPEKWLSGAGAKQNRPYHLGNRLLSVGAVSVRALEQVKYFLGVGKEKRGKKLL